MLKAILENLDGVDDALKPFYTEKDGKFSLQVEGMETEEAVNGLKTALVKERSNVDAYKKLGTVEEINAKIADLTTKAEKGGTKDADHEALVSQLKADHETALSEKDTKITGMMTRQAAADLKAELAKAGVVPEGLDLLAGYASSRIKFNDDGTPKVMSSDGLQPMIGSGANGGANLTDLAKELASTIPHLVKDDGAGGGGKPPNSGGKPQGKTVKRTDYDAMDSARQREVATSGAKIID